MARLPILVFAALAFSQCAFAFKIPIIPLNWSTVYPCAVDVRSRVLAHVVTTQHSDNTAASCIERCAAANYTYTGVEYSNECHCGTSLASMPIYKSPALTPRTCTLRGCFVDTPNTPAFISPVHTTVTTNLDLVEQFVRYCTHVSMPFAGVENASDCQCSFGYASGVVGGPESECNSTCTLPPWAGNEYCGAVQRLMVYKYQS